MIDFENRLGLRIGVFLPAENGAGFEMPSGGGNVEPLTVERWVGGITDRTTRGISETHTARRAVLIETSYPDLLALPQDLWGSCRGAPAHEWVLEQIYPSARPTPKDAGGLVLSCMVVDPEIEEEFNEWYNEEHMMLLSEVPGMLSARRFRALSGHPGYVAVYHMRDVDVYKEQSWANANKTPWIRRIHRYRLRTLHLMFKREG